MAGRAGSTTSCKGVSSAFYWAWNPNGGDTGGILDGTVSQLWNATANGSRGTVRFAGVAWNRQLSPGASAQFGFCANR